MAVQEYIKSAARQLVNAATNLREQEKLENAESEKKVADLDKHINLAEREIGSLRAEETTASDASKLKEITGRTSQLQNEIDNNKKQISQLEQQISQNRSTKEALVQRLMSKSQEIDSLAANRASWS